MQLKLKVTKGKHAGQEVAVPGPKFLIGRAEDCHLRAGSDAVSRHHCVIMIEEGYVGVRDFGSKNGTYVNDQRVVGERPLKSKDVLRVGPLEFEAVLLHEIGGQKRSKVKDVSEVAARITGDASTAAIDRDVDISDWLDDKSPGRSSETIEIDAPAGETGAFSLTASDTHVAKKEVVEPASRAKLEFEVPKPDKPKDSRSAAIDMLKKMQQVKRDKQNKK